VTVIDAVPLFTKTLAGTKAVKTLPAPYEVCRATSFHSTAEACVNPCPFMVNWKARPPWDAEEGARDRNTGAGFEVTDAAKLLVRRYGASVPEIEFGPRNAIPFEPQRSRFCT